MVWDILLAAILITFALTGWATGLSKKWYAVPVSVVVATVMCQHLYVDAATFLSEILQLEPIIAIMLAYLALWIFVQQFIESVLTHYRAGPSQKLVFLDKLLGAVMAFSKILVGFVFASMVAYAHSNVPFPTALDWQDKWLAGTFRTSRVLVLFHTLAEMSHPVIGKYVMSDAAPRYIPDFVLADPFSELKREEKQHGRDVYKQYKNFKDTEDKVFDSF